jgi:hypothetical protein
VAVLKANNLTGSMGRVSSAGDNAAMESFYSLAYAILVWIELSVAMRKSPCVAR